MTKKSMMITATGNATAFAAALAINSLGDKFKERADELKSQTTEKLKELRAEYDAEHAKNWATIETELGLEPELDHALCADHHEHGVVFIDEVEPEAKAPDIGNIGDLIAQALGGQVTASSESSGVISVPLGTIN